MYSEKELKAAAGIIREIARENHVTAAQVRADLLEAIKAGRSNPDPAAQARWATFHYAGAEPTPEEFILWATASAWKKMH